MDEKELEAQRLAEQKAKEEAEAKAKAEQEAQKEEEPDDDDEFIKSLLGQSDEDEEKKKAEEEQRRKNKDAEEARKRREAEAKAKAEEEAKKKAEEEAKKKAEEDAKKKAEDEANKQKEVPDERAANEKKLGAQLVDFKKKYPDVDLGELDKDKNFRKFIDGKLLGKQDFTKLYEDFVEMKAEIGGATREAVEKNYKKANSSSGSSQKGGGEIPQDIYSIEELEKISQKLPYMSRQEAKKVSAKIEKSIAYHEKK